MYVTLVIQHAMRMRRVIQLSVACPGLQLHPPPPPASNRNIFRKLHDFREEGGMLLNKIVLWISLRVCLKYFSV